MTKGCDLPVPAQGDVYTHDGELKITNAAANIFVVYDRQPQGAARSPSSLSVDFVLGNVYLIDSAYFSAFKGSRPRRFGNLIKGLGLDFEGCRRGNTHIKTVYDDVVCVVDNQRGTNCSIGTVAGNLITVLDLSQVFGHPKPHNVAVSYIHGLTLHESHLAYGGGLHRAKKMEQLGIKLYPETRITIRKASKKKQKKSQSNMDGSRFATGANCTILQRPLPAAPPVHNIASVRVKQEHED
ncbi:hypothetical protein CSPAE12_02402 [Colletotrichum incanum]|nr:hypothetical protein CSPAE12_02402 [Colletotrichum incanum]